MRADEISVVIRCVNGYWPTPKMAENTHRAFTIALKDLDIEPEAATEVIKRLSIEPDYKIYPPKPGALRAALLVESRRPTESQIKPCPMCEGSRWFQSNPTGGTVGPQAVVRCQTCAGLGTVARDSLEEEGASP